LVDLVRFSCEKNVKFEQGNYWKHRISGEIDLSKVGHRSLGSAYNHWIYKRRFDVLSDWAERNRHSPIINGVLDLACGSGVYIDFWRSKGAAPIVGVDISKDSVQTLRKRHPAHQFIEADITLPLPEMTSSFQLVTLFDVLYHIVNDQAAETLLKTVSKIISKGDGTLLLFDQILPNTVQLTQHVKLFCNDVRGC
jgi:SAM-dependent methyltransferase